MKELRLLLLVLFLSCSSDHDPSPIAGIISCNDGIKNGTETGVDCGGTCQKCDEEIFIPETGYQSPSSYSGYSLVWSDSFDKSELDQSKWSFHLGDGCPNLCGWGNNEQQSFSDSEENLFIHDNKLIIAARPVEDNSNKYTSSRIHTDEKFEFKYGRIDIRASMPKAPGTWVALFMLNKKYSIQNPGAYWPSGGEIDIMEYLGEDHHNVMGTGHFGRDFPNNHHYISEHFSSIDQIGFDEEFYVFSIIWEEDKITWLVNNIPYHELNFDKTEELGQPYPFNDEFFLIMALSVGGNLPQVNPKVQDFPDYLIIDYINIFQKN